jgi:hypothetical protein
MALSLYLCKKVQNKPATPYLTRVKSANLLVVTASLPCLKIAVSYKTLHDVLFCPYPGFTQMLGSPTLGHLLLLE